MKKKIYKLSRKIVGTISDEILSCFVTWRWESYGQFAQRMWGLPYKHKELSHRQIYESVRRARKQGWLEQKKTNDQIYYRLTKQGRIKQLILTLKKSPLKSGKHATIVIFDIPEEKRTFRNYLRRLLKQMEFTMVQKSVFIAPHLLPREFYILLEELGLGPCVKIIEGQIRYKPQLEE